jgi:hypothetical protein
MATIETFFLHYNPEQWRTRRGLWGRRWIARYLPTARYGGWELANAYGEVTYLQAPSLDSAAAQAAAGQILDRLTYPHLPRIGWLPKRSGRGAELYQLAIILEGDEPDEGTVLRSANGIFSYVRAGCLVRPGDPITHRWFATWATDDGDQVVYPRGEAWAGIGDPMGTYGPRVGAAMSLEERHGPFTAGDPALYAFVTAELERHRELDAGEERVRAHEDRALADPERAR